MEKKENNFAFIDSQNLNLGIRYLGWKLDYKKFRIYLKETWGVKKAYILIFKPVLENRDGTCKGNVDADLVLRAMIDYSLYDQAVIVTSDGDFYCLVDYLRENSKLKTVLSPVREKCSKLLKTSARSQIFFIDNLQKKLEYK